MLLNKIKKEGYLLSPSKYIHLLVEEYRGGIFSHQENLTLQARLYLGSILFGKFIPPKYHPKGGINHVEYRFENETIVNSSLYESRKISHK